MDSRLRGNDEELEFRTADDIIAALQSLQIDPAHEIILIAGTLYLAGGVLEANGEAPA
jgi:dihydrofolate synthase/folylpolyglutamate synthase